MAVRVATSDDAEEVGRRLGIVGFDDGPRIPDADSIIILGDGDAFMILNREPEDGLWYVQHVKGRTADWLQLLRGAMSEMIARGHGATNGRWQHPIAGNPELQLLVDQVVRPRIVSKTTHGATRQYGELTPNEALTRLG